ncbi:MAG: hypothetical protein H0W40_03745 [Methylibium sp.]|uniref:hypothetical protein n=1 Tax=Methylibium sp. TaxID=2067992 RepID=UPI0017C3E074|nr:hypothetical protein [Methylibium sp.]MBA3596474.1 hypothetical protein [Methylibium sp.]
MTVARDALGRVLPGSAPLNPAGRPIGSRGRRGRELLAQLEPMGVLLLSKAVAVALDEKNPDSFVLRDLLSRCLPPPEKHHTVEFALPDGTLAEQSAAILAAVSAGELTPAEGDHLAAMLASHARVIEVHEYGARLDAVERALQERK